jgi:hypothetical protein
MGKREIHKFWNFFKSIKQKKGKSLEIASFDGYLMGLMKNIGWDVYGCEKGQMNLKMRKENW